MPRPYAFETRDCGRCGGSGHYSYNQIDGTRCYGCRGSGKTLTPRAKKAKKVYDAKRDAMLMVRAADLTVGTAVWIDGMPGFTASRWRTVNEVRPDTFNEGRIMLTLAGPMGYSAMPDSTFRRAATPEEVAVLDAVMARYLGKGVVQVDA